MIKHLGVIASWERAERILQMDVGECMSFANPLDHEKQQWLMIQMDVQGVGNRRFLFERVGWWSSRVKRIMRVA